MRNLLFSALAVALPPQMKPGAVRPHGTSTNVPVTRRPTRLFPRAKRTRTSFRKRRRLYDLDPALIRSVIETESAFNASAVSQAGAAGLMQLMPAVAASLGVDNLLDPRENIMGGAQLLRELHDRYRGNLPLMLASYNAGATAVAALRRGFRRFQRRRRM